MTDDTGAEMPAEADVDDAPTAEVPFVPDHPVLAALAARHPDVRWEERVPVDGPYQPIAHVERTDLVAFAASAKELGFETFIDLCGVDHLGGRPRFEVVVELLDMKDRLRLRIRVPVPGTDPIVPSLTPVFAGADFYERETWDLFGIDFEGHPELTRILLPDDWEGHPLRKDYSVGSVPVQFKGAHKAT